MQRVAVRLLVLITIAKVLFFASSASAGNTAGIAAMPHCSPQGKLWPWNVRNDSKFERRIRTDFPKRRISHLAPGASMTVLAPSPARKKSKLRFPFRVTDRSGRWRSYTLFADRRVCRTPSVPLAAVNPVGAVPTPAEIASSVSVSAAIRTEVAALSEVPIPFPCATPDVSPTLAPAPPEASLFVPGDFLGLGKVQFAFYRPGSGEWFVWSRPHLIPLGSLGGQPGDIPVPADYSGSGRTEIAIFRPAAGPGMKARWLFGGSEAAPLEFGEFGDIPVPGDYDRLGRAQPAVYSPATSDRPASEWNVLNSQTIRNLKLGGAGDVPVPADYLGNGRVQPAVFSPATQALPRANWWIYDSNGGSTTVFEFGSPGDVPMPFRSIRDGRVQPAVVNPAPGLQISVRGEPQPKNLSSAAINAFGRLEQVFIAPGEYFGPSFPAFGLIDQLNGGTIVVDESGTGGTEAGLASLNERLREHPFASARSALLLPAAKEYQLLINPGPRYVAGKTLVSMRREYPNGPEAWSPVSPWRRETSSLSEAHKVPLAHRNCPSGIQGEPIGLFDMGSTVAPGGACESYYFDTRFYHLATEYSQKWNLQKLSGGDGVPITFQMQNIAADSPSVESCGGVREFGLVFDGARAVKQRQRLGFFRQLIAHFKAQLIGQSVVGRCLPEFPFNPPFDVVDDEWNYLTVDIRLSYFSDQDRLVRGDGLTLTIYHFSDRQDPSNPVIFKSWGDPHRWDGLPCTHATNPDIGVHGCSIMVNGAAYGAALPPSFSRGEAAVFAVDLKDAIQRFLPPPAGYQIDDAVVYGLDIYTSQRGGSAFVWNISDVGLVGVK